MDYAIHELVQGFYHSSVAEDPDDVDVITSGDVLRLSSNIVSELYPRDSVSLAAAALLAAVPTVAPFVLICLF